MLELSPGARFGPYRVLRTLGRGGMGAVYAVAGPQGQELALKLLDLSQADSEGLQRFQREAESHARVDRHPSVARIHASGLVGSQPYLVIDLLPGGDLASRLKAGPLPPAEVRELGVALAEGLAHIHAQGVLHRDLKPSNVLFDEGGRPRLTDFGIARPLEAASEAASLTRTGEILGTPGFLSPEQAGAGQVGPASDVFGLGATLYAALSGSPPFLGPTLFASLDKLLREPPPPLPASVPPDLRAAIERALAKDPSQRFPDAAAFGRALTGSPAPLRPRWLWPALLTLVASALLAGAWALASQSPAAEAQVTPRASEAPTVTPSATRKRVEAPAVVVLRPGLDHSEGRAPRWLVTTWLAKRRFLTLTDNGVLSTWDARPEGPALESSREVGRVPLSGHWSEFLSASAPGLVSWGSEGLPLEGFELGPGQRRRLSSIQPRLRLPWQEPNSDPVLLLLDSEQLVRWTPARSTFSAGTPLHPPRERLNVFCAERIGSDELLLVWSRLETGKGSSGITVIRRLRLGPGGDLEILQEVDFPWLCRSTCVLEGELLVGTRVGGLFALSLPELRFLRRYSVPGLSTDTKSGAQLGVESLERAHLSPAYGVARGPGTTFVSLGAGTVDGEQMLVPGVLRVWSREGQVLATRRLSELGRCVGLAVSEDRSLGLVWSGPELAVVRLRP